MSKKEKVKRKNLTTHWSNVYVALSLFFILGFGFFLTSKVYMEDKIDILNTEIGKEFNLNANGTFMINDWVYDEQKNKMQITLITSKMSSYLSELNFESVARIDVQNKLETEVVYSSNDIYIININDIPKNFEQIALRLIKNDISFEEEFEQNEMVQQKEKNNIITSIYTDERKVKKEEILETDVKYYAVKVTDEMIEESQNEIENTNKTIESETEFIAYINGEIVKLKQELIYQTLEEQTATNNEIYQLEKEIETHNREIKNLELDIQSYDAKIKRLEQRKRDLEF